LVNYAKKIISSVFGDTYAYEQLFLSITQQKQVENTTYWWPFTRCSASLLSSSNWSPELQKLSNKKQHQISQQCCAI